jgi:hypothetical protein
MLDNIKLLGKEKEHLNNMMSDMSEVLEVKERKCMTIPNLEMERKCLTEESTRHRTIIDD